MSRIFVLLRSQTTFVVTSGALILCVVMGIRQSFGLFIGPMSFGQGMPVTLVAFSVAFHNIVWGVAQPFAGAAADRYGSAPVIAFGAVTLGAGLVLSAMIPSGVMLVLGMGLLVGVGISCTSLGIVLTAVGRVASSENRSMAMGLANAGGSLGQIIIVPLAHTVTEASGVSTSLLVLAFLVLVVAPFGIILDRRGHNIPPLPGMKAVSLSEVLSKAWQNRGYRLLTVGYFACGFQLSFVATHLPGYLALCHMPIGMGAEALSLVGVFNLLGSWACGWLGGRFRQQTVLGFLYLLRGITIAIFFLSPKTETSVVIFAAVIGLTWMGTLSLTSGLVAKVFGVRHLGTLFGVCFLSHQIGSFSGAWLGGLVFEVTGSYSLVWGAAAAAGLFAALLHFPIKDTSAEIPVLPNQAHA